MTYKVDGLCLPVEFLVLGPIQNNVYLIGPDTEGATIVVDPSCQPERILEALDGRVPAAIVITHCHYDHIGAAAALREATGAPVIASAIDAPCITGEQPMDTGWPIEPCPVDHTVTHGDELQLGGMTWKVIGTPGHTPGGICLFLDARFGTDPAGMPILVSGDTLFCGAIGRTDFPESNPAAMRESLARLAELPDDVAVLPGHNSLTTIGAERHRVFERFA